MNTTHLNTLSRTTRHATLLFLLAGSIAATQSLAQGPAPSPKSIPKASLKAAPLEDTTVENMAFPIHEPPTSYSAALRAEQEERRKLRESLNWTTLPPDMQESLWDLAVGPDQLNDGRGKARLRPSESTEYDYEPRDGDYGPRDLPLVELSWVFTPNLNGGGQRIIQDSFINVEGDVVLSGHVSGNNAIKILEVDGTADLTQGWTLNWSYEYTWGGALDAQFIAAASDVLGNTFVSGFQGTSTYPMARIDGTTGASSGISAYGANSSGNSQVTDMAVDAEGLIYVLGNSADANNDTRWFVARHTPSGGGFTRNWITYLPASAVNSAGIKVNRFGEVFIAGARSNPATPSNADIAIYRLGAHDGVIEWSQIIQTPDYEEASAIELDFQGNPHISVRVDIVGGGVAGRTIKCDRQTGAILWNQQITGENTDLAIDAQGNVYVAGTGASPTSMRLAKYTPTGTLAWNVVRGTTTFSPKVALDYLGNPYIAAQFGNVNKSIETVKCNPADGATVWSYTVTPLASSGTESNQFSPVSNIIVDAGGSVYVVGNRSGTRNGNPNRSEFYCFRLEQPYVSIPQIAKSTPNVRIENHSVWFPAQQDLGGLAFNQEFPLFSFDVDALLNEPVIDDLLSVEIDYALGTARGEIDLDLSTNVSMGVDFVTSASGGSYDATASGELSIAIPGEGELVAGQPFEVLLDFEPDPQGLELIANSNPVLSAAFKSNVTGTLDLDVRGFNRNFGGDFNTIFDVDVPTPALTSLDNLTLFNVIPGNLPPAGTWANFSIGGVSGRVTMPKLEAEGVYSAREVSGTNPSSATDDDSLRLASTLSETFCDVGVSVTDLITTAATGFPLSFGWGLPAGDGGTDVNMGVGLLQATFNGSMKMEQDLTMDMTPYVRFEFPGTSLSPITVNLVKRVASSGNFSFQPESPVNFNFPSGTSTLEVKPFFGMRAKMRNSSGLRFGADAGFDAFSIGANISVLDVNILNRDYCLGCTSIPIFSSRLTLFDQTSPTFNFTGDEGNEIELATIQVVGDASNNPQLIGASKAAVPMIIYEQRTPTAAELTAAAGGTEPMVLYGRRFYSNTSAVNRAFIRHHGRTEEMTTTRLNDQSLLVQVPKRFYLLPGIARIWTTNGNGRSETIDFPIEYPFPNFQGIQGLDGADEVALWAGDPRLRTQPIIATDGGTPAGNDSFIARRDYYTLLRTTLWSSGLFPVGHSQANATAQTYFPSFKSWELPGQRANPPGFPTLVINDVALARHRPFINDGFFRSTAQASLFDLPHVATLQIFNPTPGGGPSRIRTLEVPAPKPVIAQLNPPTINPEQVAPGNTLRLTVFGPDSVPYFPSYEKAKAGNFTQESYIIMDGVPMPTTFINSGQLVADVPSTSLTPGNRLVSVFTPSGNTSYTERLRTGPSTYLPSTTVPSGGESIPLTLPISWPRPIITALSQPSITQGLAPYDGTPADGSPDDGHNFGLSGANFAPGCIVYFNGNIIPSTRVSANAIRCTITNSQVANSGPARFTVVNPSPSARSSAPFTIQIQP